METATTTASTTGGAGAMRAIVPAAPTALSGFFLWPILIMIIAAIVGIWIMYKTFGLVHGYIDSGKAEHHWHVVWGWLSSPLRVVETQDKVLAVEGKVDRLLLAQGARP